MGCKDDPPVEPEPDPAVFNLNFDVKWGNNALVLSQPYTAASGRNYTVDALKYYVCNLSLIKPDNSFELVKDVALVDMYKPASLTVGGEITPGSYTGIKFGIGLDSARNHIDPATFPIEHPMSTTTGMFWTWFTQYIFTKIEGTVDSIPGDPAHFFLYHTGIDSLYREIEFTNMNIVVAEGETKAEAITLDMEKLFWGANDTIDVITEYITHTTDDVPLAVKVVNNFSKAFRR